MAKTRRIPRLPILGFTMLSLESAQVVTLRLMKLAAGGPAAAKEARLMVDEKIAAAAETAGRLAQGATADSIVQAYRVKVRANRRRLSR